MRTKNLLIMMVISALMWWWQHEPSIDLPPGVQVDSEPRQETIRGGAAFAIGDYTLTPLAKFDITAKVLSTKAYSSGREADLSPLDLALGWRLMSDQATVDQVSISQGGRWYRYRYGAGFPFSSRNVSINSANMHMIPADDLVNDSLAGLKRGPIVQLIGKLVNVKAGDGWRWKSSLTRNDTGGGACELVYVESVFVYQ